MNAPTSTGRDANREAAAWPWECLDCGATIYHDGEFCLDCLAAYRAGQHGRRNDASEGFLDWMREEPVSAYALKVTAVAGAEVTLTALWLEVLARGTAAFDLLAPVLA